MRERDDHYLKDSAFPPISINVHILRPVYTKEVFLSPSCLEWRVSEKRFGQHKSGALSTLGSHFLKSWKPKRYLNLNRNLVSTSL